jgi:hypothetical protein
LTLDTTGGRVVSQAGATLLVETVRAVGLEQALSSALARWRRPTAVHDPDKVMCDLAIALALGGDCLADIATRSRACSASLPPTPRCSGS